MDAMPKQKIEIMNACMHVLLLSHRSSNGFLPSLIRAYTLVYMLVGPSLPQPKTPQKITDSQLRTFFRIFYHPSIETPQV